MEYRTGIGKYKFQLKHVTLQYDLVLFGSVLWVQILEYTLTKIKLCQNIVILNNAN